MKDIVLIGGGGHCKSIIDSIISGKKYIVKGIIDLQQNKGKDILGIKIIGSDNDLPNLFNNGIKLAFISLGSVGNPDNRKKIFKVCKEIGFVFPNIMDNSAIIAKDISIGEGTYIGKACIINTSSKIGKNVILNTGCIIEHDCVIGEHVHVAPRCILGGNVKIGNCSHVGLGSCVIQNITIGNNTVIGAGSVVVKNIKSNVVAYGNPCREVRNG